MARYDGISAGESSWAKGEGKRRISSRRSWWAAGAAAACCTLGAALALAGGRDGTHGGRESELLQQRRPLEDGLADWEKSMNAWSDGVMLYGILDEDDGTTLRTAPSPRPHHERGRVVVSAALQRGSDKAQTGQILAQRSGAAAASSAKESRGKQMMLWNAAAGDEITSGTLGRRHPSDADSLWQPKIGGLGHVLTEDEFLNSRARGAQVTSSTGMEYHPMQWLQQEGEPGSRLARTISLADAYAFQLRQADKELHEAHAVQASSGAGGSSGDWRRMQAKGDKYWWNTRTGATQWDSPMYNKVREEQSKLLGVHNEGIEGELKHLKAMSALN
jgi:hypothetical protein